MSGPTRTQKKWLATVVQIGSAPADRVYVPTNDLPDGNLPCEIFDTQEQADRWAWRVVRAFPRLTTAVFELRSVKSAKVTVEETST